MAGCYGNSPEDKYFEGLLHRHLNELYGDKDGDGLEREPEDEEGGIPDSEEDEPEAIEAWVLDQLPNDMGE